ncbi:uncharacterized protein PV07_12852 [Cladophialophora immunda]|uniref:Uncharacterized protein n=1 Tax=Cladophialophora immunda TaxID=569365 RepID=A0A0D2CDT0_9EURO|nr:uncharacterized protein PV07_12852 [Cladophialophora immunda]KIW21714.1 hypothetical protein PV07_12852 [Cladophialophora immunda]
MKLAKKDHRPVQRLLLQLAPIDHLLQRVNRVLSTVPPPPTSPRRSSSNTRHCPYLIYPLRVRLNLEKIPPKYGAIDRAFEGETKRVTIEWQRIPKPKPRPITTHSG